MTRRYAMAQATAVALAMLGAGFAGGAVRHPSPVTAAPGSARATLPVLPLVQRFKVGKTCNDIAVLPRSHVLVIAQSAGGRAVVVDEGTGRQLARRKDAQARFPDQQLLVVLDDRPQGLRRRREGGRRRPA